MRTRSLKLAMITAAVSTILGSMSCRRAPRDLSGRWTGHMEYTEGRPENSTVELLLVENGTGLTGTLRWRRADNLLVEFRISTGVVGGDGSISLDGEGGNALFSVPMTFEGRVDGDTIQGTVQMRVPTGLLSGRVTTETGELTVERSALADERDVNGPKSRGIDTLTGAS